MYWLPVFSRCNLIFDTFNGIEVADWDSTIPADGFLVKNNIVMNSKGYAIQEGGTTGANIYKNNVLYQNLYNVLDIYTSRGSKQTGTRISDPGLVNFQIDGSGDYHLGATSVCINTGTTSGAPSNDFDGYLRTDGFPDIGPYEAH